MNISSKHQFQASTYTLPAGTLKITCNQTDHSFAALFDIAQRRNPRRSFLFVSKVLGRHIPVAPSAMRQIYQQLAGKLDNLITEPVLFIGLAETAVGLGAGIFDVMQPQLQSSVYLTSTRHPVNGHLWCSFQEEHSHATEHLIYFPSDKLMQQHIENAHTIVLVDDEATTGKTFQNLLQAIQKTRILNKLQKIITVTLTDWSNNALQQNSELPVHAVSLISGQWQWLPNLQASMPSMPHINITARKSIPISNNQSWGRLGMMKSTDSLGLELTVRPDEKILVLGSGEFVWLPFLLAERLEAQGAQVSYSSISRSPIAKGLAIQSVIAFTDNYGLGIPNFVYNIAHQKFDRILLCIETPPDSVDPLLLKALDKIAPRTEIISYV
ncbi:phosphoribosyltransferase domain-containing protein [Neisseriaceae bacterium ESL0693]|nr:phosphoribosyltransferase domain-containing protein [Neisseriaceae bacterium ESL0693]